MPLTKPPISYHRGLCHAGALLQLVYPPAADQRGLDAIVKHTPDALGYPDGASEYCNLEDSCQVPFWQ